MADRTGTIYTSPLDPDEFVLGGTAAAERAIEWLRSLD
jgi:hypothetical protein